MAVIPEMIFSPEALQAIRETVLKVMQSDEGQKAIEEACKAARAARKESAGHRRRVI